MRLCKLALAGLLALLAVPAHAAADELAVKFGARPSATGVTLSPNGRNIAYIAPYKNQGSALYVYNLDSDAGLKRILASSDEKELIERCNWIANDRLFCHIGSIARYGSEVYAKSSLIALDADGGNMKLLSKQQGSDALYVDLRGGSVIDYLPEEDGVVLMTRAYVPEVTTGTTVASSHAGLGVDRIDTRTMSVKRIEKPRPSAAEYITDGFGTVRIIGHERSSATGYAKGEIDYYYRMPDADKWISLNTLNYVDGTGFNPYAVDAAKNVAYGFEKVDGRLALVSVALDGSMAKQVLVQHPDVDVDGLIRIGKRQRVVGASYATEYRTGVYFDPAVKAMKASLAKALPHLPLIEVIDASVDERVMLIWAGSDTNPGQYYLFDRTAKKLEPLLRSRFDLDGIAMGKVEPVTYAAADGTLVPGYLTLPPGSSGKGLPAIVMPHGGPSARDEWGFDWLAQYYVSRGFAVLQPNYRGSSGYGDAWYQDNGFQSWRTAIGDVTDAGRWLVKEGIADPDRLFIVGWSYGGYAALQSAVVDPGLFKAVVAIAPVTDLAKLKADGRQFTSFRIVQQFIGSGPHIEEGSPARNAAAIAVPVQLYHGDLDLNVSIEQSRFMADRLKAAGKRVELVEYPKLEHSLDDSQVRAEMLQKSADFLLAAAK